jgi:fused signal recognition particle receptor
MEELSKIKRTLAKNDETAPHLTLLVVDATTGANALQQAREFHKACPLDGLIVTKMDGSGKGGVAVSIYDQLGIAPRYLGTGEEPEEFALFNKQKFVEEML